MRTISVTINGEKWKATLMNEFEFVDKHGSGYSGMTHYDHKKKLRTMDFCSPGLSKSTVVHEVAHAYMSYFDLSRMSYGAIEEKICDMLGYKARYILRVADTIGKEFGV
jgi:hypothetical protein